MNLELSRGTREVDDPMIRRIEEYSEKIVNGEEEELPKSTKDLLADNT